MNRIYTYIFVGMILTGLGYTNAITNLLGNVGTFFLNGLLILLMLVWGLILGTNFLNKVFDRFFPAKY